jgi:hypothetical protein
VRAAQEDTLRLRAAGGPGYCASDRRHGAGEACKLQLRDLERAGAHIQAHSQVHRAHSVQNCAAAKQASTAQRMHMQHADKEQRAAVACGAPLPCQTASSTTVH